jgi:predicted esterase
MRLDFMIKQILVVVLLTLSFTVNASDLAKEKRWSDQVVDAIIDGDAVWLNDGSHDFLGIYTEAETDKNRAVIIMHGTGVHPNWQQVIQPLRVGLTQDDWNTLSIQMPVLANEAEYAEYAPLYDEVAPRINAAIQMLKDKGQQTIVLIGHSQGAAMAAYYLANTRQKLNGFVAIGMASLADDPRMDSIKALENIHVPVLDLYATEDLDTILKSAGQRVSAAKKAANKDYTQLQIKGNHFYDGQDKALVETVANWLDKVNAR